MTSTRLVTLLVVLVIGLSGPCPVAGHSSADAAAAPNPGLKARISQSGLNYGANVAVDVLSCRVRQIKIPDQSGRARVPVVGHVNYNINNIKVTDFNKPASSVRVQPGSGLTWTLGNAGISVRGNWGVKYRILFPISDHGWFEGHVSGASISVSVTLGANPAEQPTIRSTACSCHISGVRIKLHGGASWLYNLFMRNVEKNLRNQLQNLICAEARKAIDVDAAREMATLKTKVAVGKQLVLDYGLVAPPGFSAGFLETFHRAEFYFVGDTSEAPFQPSPLPSPPSVGRMVTFWISDYVLNTAGYAMHKHGALQYTVTKKDLPAANKTLLDLTCCPTCKCVGKMIPEAGKLYPNTSAEIQLATTAPPAVVITSGNLAVNLAGTAVLGARLNNGSLAFLIKLKVDASSAATVSFDGTTVRGSVESMTTKISVIDTAIGPVSAVTLNIIVNYVITSYVIPQLNAAGARGIPLPRVDHVQFVNTALELQQNAISVSTDVKYVGQHDEKTLYFETVDNI